MAVPTCRMTTNGRNSGERWSIDQPNNAGRITAWPRLLIGKSSVTPWSMARAKAEKAVIALSAVATLGEPWATPIAYVDRGKVVARLVGDFNCDLKERVQSLWLPCIYQ